MGGLIKTFSKAELKHKIREIGLEAVRKYTLRLVQTPGVTDEQISAAWEAVAENHAYVLTMQAREMGK